MGRNFRGGLNFTVFAGCPRPWKLIPRVLKLWPRVRFEVTVCAYNLYVCTATQLQLDSLNEPCMALLKHLCPAPIALRPVPRLVVNKEERAGERILYPRKFLYEADSLIPRNFNPRKFLPIRYTTVGKIYSGNHDSIRNSDSGEHIDNILEMQIESLTIIMYIHMQRVSGESFTFWTKRQTQLQENKRNSHCDYWQATEEVLTYLSELLPQREW